MTIYCGIDWAAHHHDVAIVDDAGKVLATRRIGENAAGLTTLLMMLAEHTAADAATSGGVGGLWLWMWRLRPAVGCWLARSGRRGHRVFEINPKASSRYRDRYSVSGSKSMPGTGWC